MLKKTAVSLTGTLVVMGGAGYYLTQHLFVAPTILATPAQTKAGPVEIYPDVPGAVDIDTSNNVNGTICNKAWSTKSIRPSVSVTDPIKTVALARYNQEHGTTYTKADGELDHLISLELGGAPADPSNLWFEPYITQIAGVQVGAHEKDKVENELHKEVCTGTLTLPQAQSIVTTDWYAFYLSHKT